MNINVNKVGKVGMKWILRVILATLYIILIYSLFEYCILLVTSIIQRPISFSFDPVDKTTTFLDLVLPLLSGVLLLIIILEMIESINEYIRFDRSSYINIITEIALISLIRHLITLDLHHIEAIKALAIGILIIVVTSFYLALKVIRKKESE